MGCGAGVVGGERRRSLARVWMRESAVLLLLGVVLEVVVVVEIDL